MLNDTLTEVDCDRYAEVMHDIKNKHDTVE